MSLPKRIAIDAMGGDGGVRVTLPAALHALELNSDLSVTLVGDKSQIEPYLDSLCAALADRISLDHTLDVISDEDKPAHVLRSGKTLSTDQTTGEIHRRHHVTADGFYKGKKVLDIGED